MRIAGVRLADGRMVWLDAGELTMALLTQVTVRLAGGDTHGEVFVTPEELLSPPARIDGLVVESRAPLLPDAGCGYLPGSEFPVLGETVRQGDLVGTVTALDPVERRVTIAPEHEAPRVVSWEDSTDG